MENESKKEVMVEGNCNEAVSTEEVICDSVAQENNDVIDTSTSESTEKEIPAKPKKKKKKVVVIVIIAVLVVLLASGGVFGYLFFLKPLQTYNNAIALLEKGQYGDARAAFESLNGFQNSAEWIRDCNYKEAVDLFNSNNYGQAIKAFANDYDYGDAKKYVHTYLRKQVESIDSYGSSAASMSSEFIQEQVKKGMSTLLSGQSWMPDYNSSKLSEIRSYVTKIINVKTQVNSIIPEAVKKEINDNVVTDVCSAIDRVADSCSRTLTDEVLLNMVVETFTGDKSSINKLTAFADEVGRLTEVARKLIK